MKILIVETVWMGGARYKFFQKTLLTMFSIFPTLQARELAAITPPQHKVLVINERYSRINFDTKYDVVLLNFVTSTAPRAYAIADQFRKKGVLVILSGFHASGMPEEAKEHADSVLVGRNESTWVTILKDIEQNQLQPFYHASLYDPSVSLPPTNVTLPGFTMTGALEATRCCPYRCEFCPETHIQSETLFYKRPIPEVIAEIKKIPQRILMFYDASLTIDPAYTKELFKQMKGLQKRFFCNGNVDILAHDLELVQLSREAGCLAWLVGFESVCQETLDTIGKRTNTVDDYAEAAQNIHNYHMVVIGDFIFGFDTDIPAVFEQTLKKIQELNIDVVDFSILTPFPGTALFKKLDSQGRILTKEWKLYNMGHAVFQPTHMTPKELEEGIRRIYNEFYTMSFTIKRIVRGLRFGIYPFFVIFARNLVAMMSRRRLFE